MSVTKSCRLTEADSERLGEAAEESNRLEGELVREAIRYYMAANPRGFSAFRGVHGSKRAEQAGAEERLDGVVYDPTEEDA